MIVAIFSNGHRDEYKGTRKVRAAWMITDKETGRVLASGHSLDRAKAAKTAQGNVAHVVQIEGRYHLNVPRSAMYANPRWCAHTRKELELVGVTAGKSAASVVRAAKAHNAALNADKLARVTIEVVDLPAE